MAKSIIEKKTHNFIKNNKIYLICCMYNFLKNYKYSETYTYNLNDKCVICRGRSSNLEFSTYSIKL